MKKEKMKEYCVWCDIPNLFRDNNITVKACDKQHAIDLFIIIQGSAVQLRRRIHAIEKKQNFIFYSLSAGSDVPSSTTWSVAKTFKEKNYWIEPKIVCGWVMP